MFKKILPLLLFASPLAAQVQYEIIDVPVCWNDSSLIKYVYVTTSGAYADLGYYNADGLPVSVSGATPTPGFCAEPLTIDSTAGRSFTITLGDQTVTWVDSVGSGTGGSGVDKLADLLDVDTAGLDSNYIIKYSPTAGEWLVFDNKIDGLTDGYKDANLNLYLGAEPITINPGSSLARFNVSTGNRALEAINNGYDNTASGVSAGVFLTNGYRNVISGRGAFGGYIQNNYGLTNNYGNENVIEGAFAGVRDSVSNGVVYIGAFANANENFQALGPKINYNSIFIGRLASSNRKTSIEEIAIGAYVEGKGDSTVVIGRSLIKNTYLNGTMNFNGYGLGNKEAADLSKTQSAYLVAFATDGTLIELDTTGLFGGSTGATTLGDLTDVTLTSPQINDILKYDGTKWINDTLSVSSGGVLSVTANNGLTNSGTATQPVIELGGTLTKNTTVSGDAKSIYFNNNLFYYIDTVFSFLVRPSVNEVANTFNIGAAANSWRSINTTDGIGNLVQIQANNTDDGVFLSSYLTATTTTFTKLELLPEEVQLITPDVNAGSATAGQVLTLVDAATGEVEFSSPATGIGLTDLSVTVATAGTANLSYNNTNGVFTYTPPDLSGYLTSEVDGSTTNELQNLSLAGTTLSISDGNSVDLSGFLRDTLTGTQTIVGNTNDYIFNGINDYQINLTGDKAFYVGHSKMYIDFSAVEMKLYASDQPINLEAAVGVKMTGYGAGSKTGTLTYLTGFDTDGFLIDVDPATISGIDLTDLSVTTNSAGTAALSYNNTNGVFTFTPPDLSSYLTSEVDGSVTNEIQDLSLAGNTLSLSGDATTVDLSPYLDESTTASNGLTLSGSDVKLGGTLSETTAIYTDGNTFGVLDATTGTSILVDPTSDLVTMSGEVKMITYGSGNAGADDLGETLSPYKAAFADDGTIVEYDDIDAMVVACSDETTAITTGTAKVTFRAPHAMTITGVRASLTTASSSGNPTVDINEGGTSILGTKLTIDANEKTSTTAATAATITDTAIADDAEITIDIDAAGTGATGLKVTILYRKN